MSMASDLPIDIVEDIFLCLDDAADLVCSSAACTSFRRVVYDSRYLRRFRSLHRRPILGLLLDEQHRHNETGLFCRTQPPRRSAQAAASFAKAADFTFSFLPDAKRWHVCDARDGRVLLRRGPHRNYMFQIEDLNLAFCDPLHRRHVQIPNIPGDLLPSAKQDGNNKAMRFGDPFLAPAIDDDESPSSSFWFQVMCTGLSKTEVVAFVFSSATGQWRCGVSFSNRSTNLTLWSWCRQYVRGHGCGICWSHIIANVMLVLDTREMKFSITDLPCKCIGELRMAVDAGDGRLVLLVISNGYRTMHVYSKAWRDIQEPEDWCHESSIPIMPGFHMWLAGAAEGYALLRGIPHGKNEMWFPSCGKKTPEVYFTLEFKTLLVERLCTLEFNIQPKFLCAGFPPLLSPPSL